MFGLFQFITNTPFQFYKLHWPKKENIPHTCWISDKKLSFFYSGGKLKRKRFRKDTFMVTYIILEIWTNSRVTHTEKTYKFPENFAVHLILFQCRNFSET